MKFGKISKRWDSIAGLSLLVPLMIPSAQSMLWPGSLGNRHYSHNPIQYLYFKIHLCQCQRHSSPGTSITSSASSNVHICLQLSPCTVCVNLLQLTPLMGDALSYSSSDTEAGLLISTVHIFLLKTLVLTKHTLLLCNN